MTTPWRGLDRASVFMISGALFLATMSSMTHAVDPKVCDWLVVALVRAFFMLVTAVVLTRSVGATLVIWRPRTLWVRSLAGSFSLVCNFYALTRLPISDVVTLTNVHPIWILLISSYIARRLPRWSEGVGVICGLAGVVLIEQPHLGGDRLAAIVALLSSVSTTVAMLGLHRLRQVDARAVVAHFAGVATLVAATWLFLRGDLQSPGLFQTRTILLLIGIGLTGTIGQILLTRAYAAGSPSKVAIVGLTQVIFAMGFDVVFWNRPLTTGTLVGFVLVLTPTTWLSLRTAKSRTPIPIPEPAASAEIETG